MIGMVVPGMVMPGMVVTGMIVTGMIVTGGLGVPMMVAVTMAMVVCFKEPADPRDGQSGDQGT